MIDIKNQLYAVKRSVVGESESIITNAIYIRYNICGFFIKKQNAQKYANKLNSNSITISYHVITIYINKKTILKSKILSLINKLKFMITGSLKDVNGNW